MRIMWTKIKRITKGNSFVNSTVSPDQWLQYFNRVYNLATGEIKQEWRSPTLSHVIDALDAEIRPAEVKIALLDMKNNKAPGWDGLPMEFYKYAPMLLGPILARLFSFLYEKVLYPQTWALSIIQPIFKKKGSPNDPDNWRGITLLPSIAKIYTKILCSRLRGWVLENKLICENQAGFRPGYSTIDNCFILRTLIDTALAKRKGRLYCCFVDFRKAFDSICRPALWYKLSELGVSGKFINNLRQMYHLNKFAVKTAHDRLSGAVASQTGVLQGCQLSPLLFIIFINDLVEFLKIDGSESPCVMDQPVHALLFADDLVLVSQTVVGLQLLLDRLALYCDHWNLEVNREKTKIVIFKKGTKLAKTEHWVYNYSVIEVVREFKYLGIVFSSNGLWKKHTKEGVGKAKASILQIMQLCYRCPYLPLSLLFRVYDATVKAALMYGAETWGIDVEKSLDAPSSFFYKKLLHLPTSASNVGTHWYVDRDGINISHKAEATLKSLLYWYKIQLMENTRLPKKCYLSQLEKLHTNPPCWAAMIKSTLENLDLQDFWNNTPRNIRIFQETCTERLVLFERDNLKALAAQFPSLCPLRVVKDLTERGAPVVSRKIQSDPEKHRWLVMTLLSCQGSLVKRHEGMTICSRCSEPVNDIFSHILASCSKIPASCRRKQNIVHLINSMQSDPESAPSTMIYWLFLSENRFRLQHEYVEFFLS